MGALTPSQIRKWFPMRVECGACLATAWIDQQHAFRCGCGRTYSVDEDGAINISATATPDVPGGA